MWEIGHCWNTSIINDYSDVHPVVAFQTVLQYETGNAVVLDLVMDKLQRIQYSGIHSNTYSDIHGIVSASSV